jgi:hypothetical protein
MRARGLAADQEISTLRSLVRRLVEEEVQCVLPGLLASLLGESVPVCVQCLARLDGRRRHTRYCTNRCRVRAYRARRHRAHEPPG